MPNFELTPAQVEQIKKALEKGYRLEVIPSKDGIKIMNVERHELKVNSPVSKR